MADLDALERLAEAVGRRRAELGLTYASVAAAGGPSPATMRRIEHPTASTAMPRARSLGRLDAALRWERGSAAGVLAGREPVVAAGRAGGLVDAAVVAAASFLPGRLSLDIPVIERVVTAGAAVQARINEGNVDDIAVLLGPLLAATREVASAYATALIERQQRGVRLPGDVSRAIDDRLRSTPVADLDQVYRRWLAGQLDLDTVPQQVLDAFEARLARSGIEER